MTNLSKSAWALAVAAIASLTTAAAVSASTAPAAERDAEIAFTNAHLKAATISQADAEKAATDAQKGAISDEHLEREDKGLVWEVKINDGPKVWEVQISATTGKVVSDRIEE